MEATELMIGDWVSLSEVSGDIRRSIVVALDVDELRVRQPQDKGCDIVGYDMITPIPLTPEILEKNGFVFNSLPFILSWVKDGIYIGENDGVHRTLGIGANASASMQYVHELQHALRLCGLTELADNFKIE